MNTLVMTSPRQPIHIESDRVPEWSDELARYRVKLVQAEKMSAAGNLLAGLVHELNSPLTTILGFSELLLREDASSAGRIQKIHAEAERSVRIIQNVLRLVRGDSGTCEVIDINDSIRRTVELAEYQLRLNRIELDLNLSSQSPRVIAHGGELTQVFLNLITNAIHAVSGVRPSGRIRICSAVMRDRVRIAIADDGPGICAADISRIFEPFFTTKENGTGLGLNLSQKIVRENGGDIWVSSTESCGATFTIELPVVTSGRDTESDSPSDDSRTAAANRSVLIVDDEDHITELIESVLSDSGYDTECLNDGGPAIDRLRKKEYDILICDLHMPGTSGRDVIEWVRSNRPNVRTLLLSGDVSGKETEELARSCGAHFLPKPFNISELRKAVQRLSS
jgi:CheY-like chemotaxis protein/two-component sensor histidine kinase